MMNFDASKVLDMHECVALLEQTLARLDSLGTGIAAIHVNAAIEQLRSNIEAIESTCFAAADEEFCHGMRQSKRVH